VVFLFSFFVPVWPSLSFGYPSVTHPCNKTAPSCPSKRFYEYLECLPFVSLFVLILQFLLLRDHNFSYCPPYECSKNILFFWDLYPDLSPYLRVGSYLSFIKFYLSIWGGTSLELFVTVYVVMTWKQPHSRRRNGVRVSLHTRGLHCEVLRVYCQLILNRLLLKFSFNTVH
jgi:hypothetical protein